MTILALMLSMPLAAQVTAEFSVRSVSGEGITFVTPDYVVVEVSVTPPDAREITVSHGHFTLRMNKKKQLLFPQAPAFVAASLKYPEWEQERSLVAVAGPVIIGRPERVGRFPGDPTPQQGRLPKPPRAPVPDHPGGIEEDRAKPEEVVVKAALPEGAFRTPVTGYLYFPHRGAIKKIKSLELIYNGPAGEKTLKLR